MQLHHQLRRWYRLCCHCRQGQQVVSGGGHDGRWLGHKLWQVVRKAGGHARMGGQMAGVGKPETNRHCPGLPSTARNSSTHWEHTRGNEHVSNAQCHISWRTLCSLLPRRSASCLAAALSVAAPPPLPASTTAGESSSGTSLNTAAVSAAAHTPPLASAMLLPPASADAPPAAAAASPAALPALASPAAWAPRSCSSMALSFGAPMACGRALACSPPPGLPPSSSSAGRM